MKKIIFIVIDGLPDEAIPELGNRTPLEAANRQNLDYLAQNGWCGFFKPLFLGKLPDSEEVHLSLFGYDPRQNLPGRGVLEAMGTGFNLRPDDVALRGNLATIDDRNKILDRRAGRIKTADAAKLVNSLRGIKIDGVEFIVKTVYGHRLVVVLRSKNVSTQVSDTDDKKIRIKKDARPLKKEKEAEFTARILNQFLEQARLILSQHPLNRKRTKAGKPPANFILIRSAGKLKKVPSFQKKWGLKAACVSNGALYKGIAKFLGMTLVKESRGDPLSSVYIKNKFLAVKRTLKKYDFIFCHIKGADLLAEDGKAKRKKEFIETIDKQLPILENLKNTLLIVTSDHATSSLKKQHEKFPVPILIYPSSGTIKRQKFTERDCRKGNLGEVKNLKIIPLVLKIASREIKIN